MRRSVLPTLVVFAAAALLVIAIVLVVVRPPSDRERSSGGDESVAGVAVTSSGRVQSITDGTIRSWRGLPYAAPPTGPLRWQPPQPPAPWEGTRQAVGFGRTCTQPEPYRFGADELTQRAGSGEDCLYLNVDRPDDTSEGLPVVVYLHGGGFVQGSGNAVSSRADNLVTRGIVLVTVNYRLGRLGFFAHPSLPGGIANFGLLDQVAALSWVRDNIAAFGGDADNVTLAGASAGAMSVNALMVSPAAEGLFDKAISQSAPTDARALPLKAARHRGGSAFPDLTADELRELPAEALLSSTFSTFVGDAPVLDEVLPRSASVAFQRGEEAAVPYLTGTMRDEFSDARFRARGIAPGAVRNKLGGIRHARLVKRYGDDYAGEVLDDVVFDLPAVAKSLTHARRAPAFRYLFAASTSSGHGSDADYVFDTVTDGRDGELSDAVADYLVAFARTGRPEVAGLPTWPDAKDGAYLALGPKGPTPFPVDGRLGRLRFLRLATS
ncbi:carboxylesterase/lipase family protein [Nocardioides plantarum]|uniref:Carboxylic ester hydrolase n=1 Tax=Nocardioides plantarum TaxID=29299 RepID=A0ABV5KEH6_9ACTN|nr:carboxylesterase family protein [Nocardioides plantarum]